MKKKSQNKIFIVNQWILLTMFTLKFVNTILESQKINTNIRPAKVLTKMYPWSFLACPICCYIIIHGSFSYSFVLCGINYNVSSLFHNFIYLNSLFFLISLAKVSLFIYLFKKETTVISFIDLFIVFLVTTSFIPTLIFISFLILTLGINCSFLVIWKFRLFIWNLFIFLM